MNMENFKIYRNGKYDTLANVKTKALPHLKTIINRIDGFFESH